MQAIDYMYQGIQNYLQEIPENTGKQIVYNFGIGFIVQTMLSNPSQGVVSGAVSALAAAIYGLVTPAFKKMLDHSPVDNSPRLLSWPEEMCRSCIALIGASCIASAYGHSRFLRHIQARVILIGLITYFQDVESNINFTRLMVLI